jgi:hypothetical protein
LENIHPINNQKIIHPITIDKNDPTHSNNDSPILKPSHKEIFSKIVKIIKNIANEVPSLNRLSHSKIKDNLLGAHTDLNKDNTATGSVAEIKAPKSNATPKGI